MSFSNKILVDFGGKKYSVLVESDYKFLLFKKVLTEIGRQVNENITQQTHWFEVYDKDFEEYVLIVNDDQIIENLSRIRVNERPENEVTASAVTSSPQKMTKESDTREVEELKLKTSEKLDPKISIEFINNLFAAKDNRLLAKNIESDDNETYNLNIDLDSLKTLTDEKLKLCDDLLKTGEGSGDVKSVETQSVDIQRIDSYGRTLVDTQSEAVNNDHIIENLARIRVNEIPESEVTSSAVTSSLQNMTKESDTMKAELLDSVKTLSIKLCNSFVKTDKESGDVKSVETQSVDTQMDDSHCRTSVGTQSEAAANDQPINYLEIKPSYDFRVSPTCPHLYYYTVVVKFRNQSLVTMRYKIGDYKGVQKLLDLMFVNRNCFAKNPSSDPSNLKWKVVSDQMVANGFKDWTSQKCRQGFSCALNLYKKTLTTCPDVGTAYKVNPLFTDLHSFDMKYLISLTEFNELRDMREEFNRKPIFSFNTTKVFTNQSRKKWPIMTSVDTKKKTHHFNRMFKISAKLDNNAIEEFKALANWVKAIVDQFGTSSTFGCNQQVSHFWQQISAQMENEGYVKSGHFWQNEFILNVCDYYPQTLLYATDEKSAQEVYPLFRFIHAMDLRKYLPENMLNRVNQFRQQFVAKLIPLN